MAHFVDESVEFIKKNLKVKKNSIAIILGSGYNDFLNILTNKKEISFSKIPNFKVLKEDEKENKFVFGDIKGKSVLVITGRLHYNFGYENSDIANLIFILKELECSSLTICASVGSLKFNLKVGDIVTAIDHINLTGRNSLFKNDYDKYGNLFVDMINPYNEHMIDILISTAKNKMGIKVKKGIYIEFNGPSIETVSEAKFARKIGADFIGFNVCCEAIASKYCKLPVVVLGLVTNYATSHSANSIKHDDVVYNRQCASSYYLKLLENFIVSL